MSKEISLFDIYMGYNMLKRLVSNTITINIEFYIGVSPSGKASDSDSCRYTSNNKFCNT